MKGLLEEFKEQLDCRYLSDLHSGAYCKEAMKVLESMELKDYTAQEWKEAEIYIRQNNKDTHI